MLPLYTFYFLSMPTLGFTIVHLATLRTEKVFLAVAFTAATLA